MTAHLSMPTELTIYTATQTRSAWLGALEPASDGPLQVNAADVAEIDAAGLQLLIALRHMMAAQQRSLVVLDAAPVLQAACARAGLNEILLPGGDA